MKYGGITDFKEILDNFEQNAIPKNIFSMTMDDYDDFLIQRRKLMAKKKCIIILYKLIINYL